MKFDINIDLVVFGIVILAHIAGFWMLRQRGHTGDRFHYVVVAAFSILAFGGLLLNRTFAGLFPTWVAGWVKGLVMLWGFVSVVLVAVLFAWQRWLEPGTSHNPNRRRLLKTAASAIAIAPVAAAGYGVFVERFAFRIREMDIHLPQLPDDLNGLSLVQLTDIHLSPFLSVKQLARVIDMANETKARLALVTGDLITQSGDPLDACLDQLARLRSEAGTFGCMGNHERYVRGEKYVAQRGADLGMQFLRSQKQVLRFGSATLNLAGVDYQPMHRAYLKDAEALVDPTAFNLLLSHNPDVFPVAAKKGFDLTLAGHTHGGQVRIEILEPTLNIARFFTPFVDGLYRDRNSAIFVSRGIGTIGMPARLGAPPEVALLRLWKS
ncbi:MAG: metallophosphoesterase [Acidobacteriota bacterium]